jgi:hypothetical protein
MQKKTKESLIMYVGIFGILPGMAIALHFLLPGISWIRVLCIIAVAVIAAACFSPSPH